MRDAATTGLEIVIAPATSPTLRRRAAALCWPSKNSGVLDLVINNAGIGALGRFAESTPDRLRQIMEVNFFAAAELVREALPLLRAGRKPIVVNVGSILGHRGIPRLERVLCQ